MNGLNNELGRREFLRKVTQTVAAAALSTGVASAAVPKNKTIELTEGVPTRIFGRTAVKLPILAYGGAALPVYWGNTLSREDRVKLVRYAYDRGVRYFDTAGNYMESQPILGEALKDIRDKVYLVTKVETTVPSQVRWAVEKCLKELQTDYLDAILIHGTPGIQQMTVAQSMKIHAELLKLRDQRITRFIGFSAHSYFDKALALISTGGFDQCMLAYGHIPRGHDQIFSDKMLKLRNDCVEKAHELKMGIAAMKVIGAGVLGVWSPYIVPDFDKTRLKQLPAAAIRYVLNDKRIHLLTIGMRFQHEIDANIKTLAGDTAYTKDDRTLLADYSAKAFESDAIKQMKVE